MRSRLYYYNIIDAPQKLICTRINRLCVCVCCGKRVHDEGLIACPRSVYVLCIGFVTTDVPGAEAIAVRWTTGSRDKDGFG